MRIQSQSRAFYPTYRGFYSGLRPLGFGEATADANAILNAVKVGTGTAMSTGSKIEGAAAAGLSITGAIFALTPALTAVCPPCGAALAIGAALVGIIGNMFKGCGQSCIDATKYANQAEPLLVQNVQNYTSAPVRIASLQRQALANFDAIFTALEQKCQQIGGQGGTNCIADRVAGACKWKATPWTWTQNQDGSYTYTPAGAAGSGSQCWNWAYGYRDPIAQDPGVTPDPVTGSPAVDSALSSISSLFAGGAGGATVAGLPLPLLLLAGFVIYEVTG